MAKRLAVEQIRAQLVASSAGSISPAMLAYAARPVAFAREVLGVDPWSRQAEILEAVAKHDRVTVASCHKMGKSDLDAMAAIHHVVTHEGARVVLTAPSYRQVRNVLWRAVRSMHRRAVVPLGGEMFDLPEHGLQFPDGREIIGFATDSTDRFAGISGPETLVIIDEASGVAADIFDAVAGVIAGGGKILLTGNPIRTSGNFFASHSSEKATLWKQFQVSAFDTPNITGERHIRGLATKAWIADMEEDFGAESAAYAVRVLGKFPSEQADAVIGLGLIEAAQTAWNKLSVPGGLADQPPAGLQVGVDPARFGSDEAVIFCRRGNLAYKPTVLRGADLVTVAARVGQAIAEHRNANENDSSIVVKVDVCGLGAGVADILRSTTGFAIVDVNAAALQENVRYARTRDALWFELKDWLKNGGAIPPDPKLAGDLGAPCFSYSPAGKIVVESKDVTKQRLKRSPDRADALALSVYAPAAAVTVIWSRGVRDFTYSKREFFGF